MFYLIGYICFRCRSTISYIARKSWYKSFVTRSIAIWHIYRWLLHDSLKVIKLQARFKVCNISCLCVLFPSSLLHIALFFCFVCLRLVYTMLPMSLNCPYLIARSVFSNVYCILGKGDGTLFGVNSGDRFVFGGYVKCRIDSKLNI
jgi:hypothetical protein